MHFTFNKQKFKHLFSISFSVLAAWLVPTFLIILVALMIQSLGTQVGSNPLKIKSFGDFFLLLLWGTSPLIAFLMWFWDKKKQKNYFKSFFVYPISLFVISIIPLFVNATNKSPAAVKVAVNNTNIFMNTFYIVLIVAFIVNLYISRQALKKSNWWLFIVALPYVLTEIYVYQMQRVFIEFTQMKDFSYSNVSRMLNGMKFSDIRLINPLWYQTISLIVASTLLLIGVSFSEIIWKKTKKWREKAKD